MIIPVIDSRVIAVGVSKVRAMNAEFLKNIQDEVYLLQDGEDPCAVVISYQQYLRIQDLLKTCEPTHD